MNTESLTSVADLHLEDALEVGADYPEQSAPAAIIPGNYVVKIEKISYRTSGDGKFILHKGQYPVLRIEAIKVLSDDPVVDGRVLYVWQDVSSVPFTRPGSDKLASQAADLLHAMDPAIQAHGTKEVLLSIEQLVASGVTMQVRIDWQGYDGDYVKAKFAEAGGKEYLTPDAVNNIYDTARVKGFKKIAQENALRGGNSKFTHLWRGPSGSIVEAKPFISRFHKATDVVNLGPAKEFVEDIPF